MVVRILSIICVVAACLACNGEKGSQRGWTRCCNLQRKAPEYKK